MRGLLAVLSLLPALGWAFTLTLIHTNDQHAHLEPFEVDGISVGGVARQASLIKSLRAKAENPLVLSGGDVFQGTLYFQTYVGLADLSLMNYIGYDAMAVGNHEFDRGPTAFSAFLENATFPVLAANIDVSGDPDLKGKVKPSAVLSVNGEKIGVVGMVTPLLPTITNVGPHLKMKDIYSSVRAEVQKLESQGINKIVVVSHTGYLEEQDVARRVPGIDVVIGGHTHTLLGKAGPFEGEGPYPTVVRSPHGTTLVVQAWDWSKVVGELNVTFDKAGRAALWHGQSHLVDDSVLADPVAASMIKAFSLPMEAMKTRVVGEADGEIMRQNVRDGSSAMANLLADAMLAATGRMGVDLAIINGGGVRADIDDGEITYGELITVQPFGNTLVVVELTGAELKQALERGVRNYPEHDGAWLHVSQGSKYHANVDQRSGDRVSNIIINGKLWSAGAKYKVVMPSFTAGGGDAHDTIKNAKGPRTDTGLLDVDALIDYVKTNSPISPSRDERVVVAFG